MVFGFGHKVTPPPALIAALRPDEQVLASAQEAAGGWLAVTRYGIWKLPVDRDPQLISWSLISKATWQAPILQLIRAEVDGELAGAELIVDRPPFNYEIARPGKLTDLIHSRIRAGIISSVHHDVPGGGGWLVVRRVPGRDGAIAQVRLDPGTDPDTAQVWFTPLVEQALEPYRPLID